MDMRAKSIWYCGESSFWLTLRMLVSDGSLCTVLYRMMRVLQRLHLAPLAALLYKINALFTGAVIGRNAEFGPGLVILHSFGTVINTSVCGGRNAIIEGGVTIGAEKGDSPVLGDRVFVGSGARVIGGIRLGDDTRIGANAVVVTDLPDGCTAVGVPARIIKRESERD
jgi:serine O-acetyltransferase